jgi:micrococcal nuclease
VLASARRVSYRLGEDPRDRYGRALAYVWLADGRLFNGMLVEDGLAVPLSIAPNTALAPRFRAAAARARRDGRGLWSRRTCAGSADRPLGGAPAGPSAAASGGDGSSAGEGRRLGERDCVDFHSRSQAQRYFEARGGRPRRNVDRLDSDGDGKACESLPE